MWRNTIYKKGGVMSTEVIGILQDVLIKEIGGSIHDKVQVINELPKSLLFIKGHPKVPKINKDGETTAELKEDRQVWVDVLKDGIKPSQTGDGGYVFEIGTNAGRERLAEIDQYVLAALPREAGVPRRDFICIEPGDAKSPPKQRNQFPRVELPVSSPPVEEKSSMTQTSPSTLEPLNH